jgi:broad specificity phosphatase PhoE
MKLIIIRHGETEWNARHKVQGLSDQPLSKEGMWQADLLGGRFAKTDIDAIYTSTLKRATKTAEAVGKYHPGLKVNVEKALNEMDWGAWEGLSFEQIRKKYPKQFASRLLDKYHFAPKGGESPSDLRKRLTPFLKKIVKKHKGQTVLIVGHGGINRVLMGIIMGWDEKKIVDVFTKNTAVNILHVKEGKSRMHLFNCVKHLEL